MVVLASSICTKSGKAVISRQFVEMSRTRIEGLLASFPKLINSGTQHTYVETDVVRYIYQPLDDLYMVIITNKQSNILLDIETLHLFSRTVSEYCKQLKESDITQRAFELLCAFDEIIASGYPCTVTPAIIKTYTEMDSHEEKLQEMIQKSKEREAVEAAKLKAKQLEMQKRELQKKGLSGTPGGFGGGGVGKSYTSSTSGAVSPSARSQSTYTGAKQQMKPTTDSNKGQPSSNQRRGMQLGGRGKASGMLEAITHDDGIPIITAETAISQMRGESAMAPSNSVTSPVLAGPVHIQLEEKINATLNRDGGLDMLEVKGELILRIQDPDKARLRVAIAASEDPNVQFKIHPHVDKNLWVSDFIIGTKDPAKPFPVNQPTPVLKWRYGSKDESMIPLAINFWPSPTGDGSIDCSVEYELISDKLSLCDVVVSIPLSSAAVPKIENVDGEYALNSSTKCLDWKIPLIDSESSSGTLEFSVPGNDASILFPVRVSFYSKQPFCDLAVTTVLAADTGTPVDCTKDVSLVTEDYRIV